MTGFFGVAVYHPKHEVNVGTLWRSAFTYNASLLATIGARYEPQASDTCKTPLSVPLHHYDDIDDLIRHVPHRCPIVGVELDARAVPLTDFVHPDRAMYLLGAEDHGLPERVLDLCHYVVQIPTPADWSLNVSVAGSILMHDRVAKSAALRIAAGVVA
ncbi:RNA methyltransferase [Rhodococcus sp. UNC363MFTsu5.1]|uniref:RNA methyltransferase n=1 Tax=Rhodococcus sp. UNC363MFTsu5.1 TaxID=1449069 RepID=UPI000481DDAA|nr:RNA methyltransferase [Rhodococcus sp. UNC363MFTsu5.1]